MSQAWWWIPRFWEGCVNKVEFCLLLQRGVYIMDMEMNKLCRREEEVRVMGYHCERETAAEVMKG